MGFIRKVKRTELAKQRKQEDLRLQSKGFKANQVGVKEPVLKGVTFRKVKVVQLDLDRKN